MKKNIKGGTAVRTVVNSKTALSDIDKAVFRLGEYEKSGNFRKMTLSHVFFAKMTTDA